VGANSMRLFFGLLVLFFAIGTWIETPGSVGTTALALHTRAMRYAASEASLVAFAEAAFKNVLDAAGEKRSVRVNQPYSPQQINVVVADFSKVKDGRFPVPSAGLYSVRPNVVIVDVGMLSSMLLNAFNDGVSLKQMLWQVEKRSDNADLDDGEEFLSPESWGALSFHLRLRNLRYKDRIRGIAEMAAGKMINMPRSFELSLPFAYPFSHELYHIRPNAPDLNNPASHAKEERDADIYAKNLMQQLIDRPDDKSFDKILGGQMMILGLYQFQDLVLTTALDNLRGLSAEDYLITMFHRRCEVANTIPWPQRFHNPDVVSTAIFRGFPVLTSDEYDHIKSKLESFQTTSHEHLLLRVLQMLDVFQDDKDWAPVVRNGFHYSEELYSAFFEKGNTSRLLGHLGGLQAPGNKSLSELLDRLKNYGVWQQGVGCAIRECGVLIFDSGHIELYAQHDGIQQIRLVQRSTPGEHPVTGLVLSYIFDMKVASSFDVKMTEQIKSCNLAGFHYQDSQYFLAARVLNEGEDIETEIFSARKPAQETLSERERS